MCKVYNKIGSLTTLKNKLDHYNISDFKSVRDILDFKNSYPEYKNQIITNNEKIIKAEKDSLINELPEIHSKLETLKKEVTDRLNNDIQNLKQEINSLKDSNSKNIFKKISNGIKYWMYKRKVNYKQLNFEYDLSMAIAYLFNKYKSKEHRLKFLESNFDLAVQQSAESDLFQIERKKSVIKELNTFIYGAIGEQKVVKELEKLSDEYYLINDFNYTFPRAIFNKIENDYIKSIQIDHILVGPSGIFLIETKNWSKNSVENYNLRSPVEQIKRANYALFQLLNYELDTAINLDHHHWGVKKIPIKNLIILIKDRPKEEFQYVKILNLNEVLSYINYFKPILSNADSKRIADKIVEIRRAL